ncbi:hypothetical protein TNCT_170231 [Trichonephila clavata]|uniref:Uncharacterized protein n=1 Tax=Trichonephila clavata TaxID=2740835 RepID=A0A8X6JF36_TRICU|nr:hypothetical protein TNCT_170231 [Trichonephila clavata]
MKLPDTDSLCENKRLCHLYFKAVWPLGCILNSQINKIIIPKEPCILQLKSRITNALKVLKHQQECCIENEDACLKVIHQQVTFKPKANSASTKEPMESKQTRATQSA